MSRRMRSIGPLVVVFCILLISAIPAEASDVAQRSQVAQTDVRSTGLSWQPNIDFKSAVVTVSGPDGFLIRKEFARGEALEIPAVDKRGHALVDGGYTWEIRFAPVLEPAVKRALQDARESGDERAVADLKRQGKLPEGAVISGNFRVQAGSIVTPDKVEPAAVVERGDSEADPGGAGSATSASANKDIQHLDDVIVSFSMCIGNDCVNGESFGFDTLRLKENNTRLNFLDTSTSASFPQNDWRIIANDSSNGGGNYLAIEDSTAGRQSFRVDAGAPANALRVDAQGDVGLGTSTPVVDLHVVSGNTPTLRLEQDGSSGFTAQTWDVAGNEANFFVRDATNGSKLPFKIKPNAPTGSIFVEGTTGDIGLGTESPDQELDIEADTPAIRLTGTSAGKTWDLNMNGAGRFNWNLDGSTKMRIDDGVVDNLLNIGFNAAGNAASNTVHVDGDITATGTITPDYVFGSDYQLESIEEHAAFMWSNKHLPAVAPGEVTAEGKGVVNLTARAQGVLEELEKAHIYIEQLHESIQQLNERLSELEGTQRDE